MGGLIVLGYGENTGWLTLAEAGRRLGLSRTRVDQLARQGRIPYVQLGGGRNRFFRVADVDDFARGRAAS